MARTSFPSWPSILLRLLPLLFLAGAAAAAAAASGFQLTICQNEDFEKCTSYTPPPPTTTTTTTRLESSGACTPVPWNDDVSCFRVECGCCEFFGDSGCRGRLFTACNEEKSALGSGGGGGGGGDGEKISSFRCYY